MRVQRLEEIRQQFADESSDSRAQMLDLLAATGASAAVRECVEMLSEEIVNLGARLEHANQKLAAKEERTKTWQARVHAWEANAEVLVSLKELVHNRANELGLGDDGESQGFSREFSSRIQMLPQAGSYSITDLYARIKNQRQVINDLLDENNDIMESASRDIEAMQYVLSTLPTPIIEDLEARLAAIELARFFEDSLGAGSVEVCLDLLKHMPCAGVQELASERSADKCDCESEEDCDGCDKHDNCTDCEECSACEECTDCEECSDDTGTDDEEWAAGSLDAIARDLASQLRATEGW